VDFPKKADKAIAHATAAISQGQAFCEFRGMAPGTYAISVFHDENANEKPMGNWTSTFLGIPREGVGASNNAKGRFGPPKFRDAGFHFSGGRMEMKITINYL